MLEGWGNGEREFKGKNSVSIVRECVYVMTQLQCKLESAVHGLAEQGATKAGEKISKSHDEGVLVDSVGRRRRPPEPMHPSFLISSKVNNAHVVTSEVSCSAEKRETMI